jgi:hypothetical protein
LQKDIAAKLPNQITGRMKQLDEREYHLSNFHRDLMEAQSPAITEGYDFLQSALK